MSIEDILQALDEECRAECQEIFRRAEQEAKQILEKAREEAESIRQARLAKIRAEAQSEATSILYSARLRAKNSVIQAKERVVEKALRQAVQGMEGLRSRGDYPDILAGLIEEGLSRVGGRVVVHVDPADRQLAEDILRRRGVEFEVRTDIETRGGAVVSDPEERVRIINTVEERLNRAREKLRLQVSALLFGEEVEAAGGGG
ncbi:V-type ATP synthase subunit E [Candidatus Solincola sp.]|jgi:vacuolar-type H+-ATPase subunit E/Vma4|nr:V-type ATP synthase subunit E [Actinomycetota bacterium]MDI7252038.1 V-type ATP synthase subunit E [Actinomycetota bacterium]